jgi:hypothetical protein
MKKIFTLMGLAALSFGINAQTSSILLSEDFSDGKMDASLTSTNPNSVNDESAILQFNSVDILSVNLKYAPNPNAKTADSISITYDVSFVTGSGGFDSGRESLYYVEQVSKPFSFGTTVKNYQLYLQGEDMNVSNSIIDNKGAKVSKGFASPISNSLDLINFKFEKTYLLDGKTASTPEMLAAQVCPVYSSNPNEIAICTQQVIMNAPTIQNSLRVDNIVITSHKVTGIEGSTTTNATPVKAFNLLGREVAVDTKNEVIIMIYSDGSSVREYNAK